MQQMKTCSILMREAVVALGFVACFATDANAATCTYSGSWDVAPSSESDAIDASAGGSVGFVKPGLFIYVR